MPSVDPAGAIRRSKALAATPESGRLKALIEAGPRHAEELIERADRLAAHSDDLLEEIEFGFLFNDERQLFSIGYSVVDGRLDNSYYDILASEARLASYMAIALGKVSHEHWFKLGRSLTPSGTSRALLSWSASMFEYLMPLLVMRSHAGTLLDETYEAVVRRQMDYAAGRGVPWGISESAYNVQDARRELSVQGVRRARPRVSSAVWPTTSVVAPYATLLAAPLAPREVVANLDRLRLQGLSGRLGYYEAIDYTPERLPAGREGRRRARHLHGASPGDGPARARQPAERQSDAAPVPCRSAHRGRRAPAPGADPAAGAAEESADRARRARAGDARRDRAGGAALRDAAHAQPARRTCSRTAPTRVMVTNAGGGYSRRQNLAMTRWREDITTDEWGNFCFVRDLESGAVWSTTHQPVGRDADEFEVTFALDRGVFRRVDGRLETRTEIVVSTEDDVELRRDLDHQPRPRDAQPRSHQLRGGRAGAAGCRPRAPGVLEPVHRDLGAARA